MRIKMNNATNLFYHPSIPFSFCASFQTEKTRQVRNRRNSQAYRYTRLVTHVDTSTQTQGDKKKDGGKETEDRKAEQNREERSRTGEAGGMMEMLKLNPESPNVEGEGEGRKGDSI